MPRQMHRILLLAASLGIVSAQTTVGLRTQSKDIDFTAAPSTKPFKSGGTVPSTCTVGEMFFQTNTTAGSNLYGCTSTNVFTLEGGGGGGAGAGMGAQLGDFQVTRTNSTTLSVGPNCTSATPCNVRFGNLVYSISSGATLTVSAGTGVALIYISSAGVLTAGHNLTLSCSGCTAQSGVSAFPIDSIPLFMWSSTGGTWDVNGGTDDRAFLSTRIFQAGAGLLLVESPGLTTVGVDQTLIGLRVTAPATATSACTAGAWAVDTGFLYSCVATNTWKRVAIASW